MVERRTDPSSELLLAALMIGAAGLTLGVLARRKADRDADRDPVGLADAPIWARKKTPAHAARSLLGKTVLINRPRAQLYDAWQVERFPDFMENVVAVEPQGEGVSRWTIKGPAGQEVELLNRISRDDPENRITWQSEPNSQIANSGEVRFVSAPADRGTYVTLVIAYQPPVGRLGRAAAKLLQREPEVQARRDLMRFKQLMETGEVTTNASPSGRKSEDPTQPHI